MVKESMRSFGRYCARRGLDGDVDFLRELHYGCCMDAIMDAEVSGKDRR